MLARSFFSKLLRKNQKGPGSNGTSTAFEDDGHFLFGRSDCEAIWQPLVRKYLHDLSLHPDRRSLNKILSWTDQRPFGRLTVNELRHLDMCIAYRYNPP